MAAYKTHKALKDTQSTILAPLTNSVSVKKIIILALRVAHKNRFLT